MPLRRGARVVLLLTGMALANAFSPSPLTAPGRLAAIRSLHQTQTTAKGGVVGARMTSVVGGKGWNDEGTGSSSTPQVVLTKSAPIAESPILEFFGENRAASIGKFEKFDDQIMGGMSQSAILPYLEEEEGFAAFTGVVRVEGGGFCGSRLKLLEEPLDLSSYAGVYLKARGDGKTYKINVRTTPTAGEAVYQAEFTPPGGPLWSVVRIPWTAFRLMKRAVPVKGAAPLPPATVYQFGFVLSKFSFGENDYNDRFAAGSFRLELQELGVYEDIAAKEAWVDNRPSTRGNPIDINEDEMIQDSLRFKANGKKRSLWGRLLLKRVRSLLRKRVSERRTRMAEELLIKRKEGVKLSSIRMNSWVPPGK